MSTPPTVLFICQHNAGRSQLGAHLLKHITAGKVDATSAGISPADQINPVVAEALGELDIDTSHATPRAVTRAELTSADVVVTMKTGLALPGPVAGELVEWAFADPDNWGIEGVRELRDRILTRVRTLVPDAPANTPVS